MLPVCASHGAKVIRIRANWIASRYWRSAFASSSLFDETITETVHEKEIILRINYDYETGDVGNGVITETFSFSFLALSTRKSAAFHSSPVAKSLKHNFPFSSPTSPWQHGRDDSSLSNGCQPSTLARFSLGGWDKLCIDIRRRRKIELEKRCNFHYKARLRPLRSTLGFWKEDFNLLGVNIDVGVSQFLDGFIQQSRTERMSLKLDWMTTWLKRLFRPLEWDSRDESHFKINWKQFYATLRPTVAALMRESRRVY